MINLHERLLPNPAGSNPRPPDNQSDEHPTMPLSPVFLKNQKPQQSSAQIKFHRSENPIDLRKLKANGYTCRFSASLNMEDNFFDFLFAILYTNHFFDFLFAILYTNHFFDFLFAILYTNHFFDFLFAILYTNHNLNLGLL